MRALVRSAVLMAIVTASAGAQMKPQTRNGFTISFGFGGGSAGVNCSGCDNSRETSPSGYLRIGGAIRPNLILAGEANAWTKTSSDEGVDATFTIGTVTFLAQWYPQPANGWFLSAGAGTGSIQTEVEVPGLGKFSDNKSGFGYQLGTGYDIRVGNNFSLTPFATYFATTGGKAAGGSKIDGNVFHFGLGFTWH
jgi:hypothetical protein